MFRYKVLYCESADETTYRESGILPQKSYKKAVNCLLNYYGEGNIIEFALAPMEHCAITDEELKDTITPDYSAKRYWRDRDSKSLSI